MSGRRVCIFITVLFIGCLLSVWVPSKTQAAVKQKQVYREIGKNFLERKRNFSISCRYTDAKTIVSRLNGKSDVMYYNVLFDAAQAAERISHDTGSGDYLYGSIAEAYCYYAEGSLHFYDVAYHETKKQTKRVDQKLTKVARQIKKRVKTDFARIQLAYRYVIKQVQYDQRKNCSFSAYDGLFVGRTVCNGYALILHKLLNKMDIPCRFISGSVREKKNWYLHAWNIVRLKGKWYNLDACSDDGDDGGVYWDFFLKSDRTYKKFYKRDAFYQTKAFQKNHKMSKTDYAFPK